MMQKYSKSILRWVFVPVIFCSVSVLHAGFKFIVVCDSRGYDDGINRRILTEIAEEIVAQDVEFILFPGDLVYGFQEDIIDQLEAWLEAMKPVYDAGIGVYVVRGNHDMGSPDWMRMFGTDQYPGVKMPDNGPEGEKHMTYYFTHENATFIGLDQYDGQRNRYVHRCNQQWLDQVLENNVKPHVFTFGHEQAFKAYHYDCLDDDPASRDAFWESLKSAGSRVYFCGHDHFYAHALVDDGDSEPQNDIHQLIIGTAGATLYRVAPMYDGVNSRYQPRDVSFSIQYGYVLVEVEGLDVSLTWIQRNEIVPGMPRYLPTETWGYSIEPRKVAFKDSNLKLAVSKELQIAEPTNIDMLLLKDFGAQNKGIARLDGLEYAENLNQLELANNSIASLKPLSGLRKLIRLDLSGNQLDDETYCEYLPKIRENNPGVEIEYDPHPNPIISDCITEMADFASLAANWLKENCNVANDYCRGTDIDRSMTVGLKDLQILAEYWLSTD